MLHSDYFVSEAIRKQKIRSGLIMASIEEQLMAKKRYDEKIIKQKENQEWLMTLIESFKNEFTDEPGFYELLEKDIFSRWGKYQRWLNALKNGAFQEEHGLYLMRTFEYVYTDFRRMEGTWPKEMLVRVWKVLYSVYEKYENSTGKRIVFVED